MVPDRLLKLHLSHNGFIRIRGRREEADSLLCLNLIRALGPARSHIVMKAGLGDLDSDVFDVSVWVGQDALVLLSVLELSGEDFLLIDRSLDSWRE